MKYVTYIVPCKNGAKLYQLYVIIDDKKLFVTSFFENRYNQKTIKLINDSFDFDAWLESQPRGTFVQGGGLDTAKENENK